MIEDQEMREIFRIESGEHLQHLDEGLLALERDPENPGLLEEIFREVHSLKGSARMLGLRDIETLSHRFEEILNHARKHEPPLTVAMVDILYRTLDAVKNLVDEALSGVSKGVDVATALARLAAAQAGSPPRADKPGSPKPPENETHAPTSDPEAIDAAPEKPEREGNFRIGTIRVETQQLDRLLAHTGELTVAKLRFSLRPAEIDDLLTTWNELRSRISPLVQADTSCNERLGQFSNALEKIRHDIAEDRTRFEFISGEIEDGVRSIRLLPLSTIFCLFPRLARDVAHDQGKETEFRVKGGETTADKRILEEMKDPLMHAIRNAIDHGIEPPEERTTRGKPRRGTLTLQASQTGSTIILEVSDDGRGLDAEKIKRAALKQRLFRQDELDAMTTDQIHALIFSPGLSTSSFVSDVSGRGVGLDVVRTKTELLKGSVSVHSVSGKGCTLRIALPMTLATTRVLLLESRGLKYAIPIEFVVKSCLLDKTDLFSVEGRDTVLFEHKTIAVAPLADLLHFGRGDFLETPNKKGLTMMPLKETKRPCIVLMSGEERFGILVDDLLDEQEVILKTQSGLLRRVRGLSGATILGTGEVCMILNPPDLLGFMRQRKTATAAPIEADDQNEQKTILVVEDTMTTRVQMKRILESAGYQVVAAVDGLDALGKLDSGVFDALVTDICMPNMDGITLTHKVRQNQKYGDMPIILVTSLDSAEDKRKGAEAGANAYLTKPAFDQKILIEALRRLV